MSKRKETRQLTCFFMLAPSPEKEQAMCKHCGTEYIEAPSITIGGPPGDYQIPSFSPASDHQEYQVVSVSSSGVNPGVVVVSGISAPKAGAVDTSGVTTYNGVNQNTMILGHVIPIGPNTFIPVLGPWERVASENQQLFVRIDSVVAAFVTIKRRIKLIVKVPAPFTTVNPYEERLHAVEAREAFNEARTQRIKEAVLEREGVAVEYGQRPQPTKSVVEPGPGAQDFPRDIIGWLRGER